MVRTIREAVVVTLCVLPAWQADLLNMTDRLNLINFSGLFSGTAVGQLELKPSAG